MRGPFLGKVQTSGGKRLKKLSGVVSNTEKQWILKEAYQEYAYELSVYLNLRLPGPEHAEDLLHDVFIVAAQKITDIDTSKPIRAWLYQVARHLLSNQKRKNNRQKTHASDDLDAWAMSDSDKHQKVAEVLLVKKVLSTLPDKLKDVVLLSDIQGLTNPEIAEIMNIPLNTAASRLRLGRKRFRETYQKLNPKQHTQQNEGGAA